ncbi:GntR family transcriptional regulator [Actinocrispum wychmicini]|uniref:DNA-binding GntR family transcriptional regulator n=1 Tax=Actinocrispum wychmicini TaxID=1213861 RepID=A0A4R2K5A2_9PSEU|nr:GntR family transcriptional regulator [Actinocrispum wychmicini]TCO65016.1 DNA-binding GntR family transcriptional regulator [Actinocrispum wychmicini]
MAIIKRPLREQIRDEVLLRMVRGDLAVGGRINEGHLADDLGVSRTPLREALANLAQEGVLELRPNRGYWVAPVTAAEVRETYPVIGALEVLALRGSSPAELVAHAPELIELADAMLDVPPGEAGAADDRWHDELLRFCPNQRLLHLIKTQKTVVHRYEFAYFYEEGRIAESAAQHRRIAEAVLAGDLDLAARELQDNWEIGMRLLIDLIT